MAFRCCPTVCSLLIITTIVFVGAAAGAHLTEQDDLIYAYTASSSVPSDCEVAVVGAGWGGIYFAWRLAVDTQTVDAAKICMFEASNRIGGRVYSVSGLSCMDDLTVDVGAYRYQAVTQHIVKGLIEDVLHLPTACYEDCTDLFQMRIIADRYGNNAGYIKPLEGMIKQLLDKGFKGVYFGHRLQSILRDTSSSAAVLTFQNGATTKASTTMLNIGQRAVMALDADSVIFTDSSPEVNTALNAARLNNATKLYVKYDDAWWVSILGAVKGSFESTAGSFPIQGRYHDGPVRCLDSKDETKFADHRVKNGKCSGFLQAYYAFDQAEFEFFQQSQTDDGGYQPMTKFDADNAEDAAFLHKLHWALMNVHREVLNAKGVSVTDIELPRCALMGTWMTVDGAIYPGTGFVPFSNRETRRVLRKPVDDMNIFLCNENFGDAFNAGWAEASLIIAENELANYMSLGRPSFVPEDYYRINILKLVET